MMDALMVLAALAFAGLLIWMVIDVERRGRQWEREDEESGR